MFLGGPGTRALGTDTQTRLSAAVSVLTLDHCPTDAAVTRANERTPNAWLCRAAVQPLRREDNGHASVLCASRSTDPLPLDRAVCSIHCGNEAQQGRDRGRSVQRALALGVGARMEAVWGTVGGCFPSSETPAFPYGKAETASSPTQERA